MNSALTWLLKKTGIYAFVWRQFCDEYPIRIGGKTPEVQKFLQESEKAFTDMMTYGLGCTQHVDPRTIPIIQQENKVLH